MLRQISLQKRGAAVIDSFELFLALNKIGIDHQVFLSSDNELKYRWNNLYDRNNIFWLNTYKNSISSFLFSFFLLKWFNLLILLRKYKDEDILATHFHPWLFFVILLKKMICRKFIYIVHENPFEPKERDDFFSLLLQKFVIKQADVIVTHSVNVKNEISKYIKVNVVFFPLGAYSNYCKNFNYKIKKSDTTTFLFLGRIESYKGVDLLLESFYLLLEKYSNIKLVIAGYGLLPDVGQKHNSIEIVNRWLSDEEICGFLNQADVVVLPYKKASQSGVLSLAWACGVPTIVSDVGGLSEQVLDKENGLIFKSNDKIDLADKMSEFIVDKDLLVRLKQGAIYSGEQLYTWNNVAKGIKDVIDISIK